MAKIDVINKNGEKVESIELPEAIFAITPNKQALFDAIKMQRASLRQGTHSTKGRSEVRGGGRKPYKQKGTGNARQGTIRAPQYKGGGIVFGPKPRDYSYKINKKVRKLALYTALINKFEEGKIIVVDDLAMETPKTSTMAKVLKVVQAERKPLVVTAEYDENIFLSTRNISEALNLDLRGLNVLDIVNAHSLVMTKEAVLKIGEVL